MRGARPPNRCLRLGSRWRFIQSIRAVDNPASTAELAALALPRADAYSCQSRIHSQQLSLSAQPLMPQALDKKVAEWRDADSKAREAEKVLTQLLFSQEAGRRPSENLASEAKQLRKLAHEKLNAAIAAIKPKP